MFRNNTLKEHMERIRFTHFVELPEYNCVIATARNEDNKTRVYLISQEGRVFIRNAINNSWSELNGSDKEDIYRVFTLALDHGQIPRFRARQNIFA